MGAADFVVLDGIIALDESSVRRLPCRDRGSDTGAGRALFCRPGGRLPVCTRDLRDMRSESCYLRRTTALRDACWFGFDGRVGRSRVCGA